MVEDLVLLADDDAGQRYLFERAFSRVAEGERLLSFSNGIDLMDYLEDPSSELPKIIFLDIDMPGLDGIECLRRIRENRWLSHIAIVIHSTSISVHDERRALLFRANLWIRKTGDPEELRYMIARILKMEWTENILRPIQ